MPYRFTFVADGHVKYTCLLHRGRCAYVNPDTHAHCRKICVIGLPMCWIHLKKQYKLRIKESTIADAGKGLFAVLPGAAATGGPRGGPRRGAANVVFNANAEICPYQGEVLTRHQMDQRYGVDHTAPYGIRVNMAQNIYEDAAKYRGVGAMANSDARHENAGFKIRNNRIVLYALRDITDGQEIFVNYGNAYDFNDDATYSTKYTRH